MDGRTDVIKADTCSDRKRELKKRTAANTAHP